MIKTSTYRDFSPFLDLILKVSKSQKKIGIINETREKNILRALMIVFQVFCLFFGRTDNSKSCFRDLLTFSAIVFSTQYSCSQELRQQANHTFLTANLDNFSNKILFLMVSPYYECILQFAGSGRSYKSGLFGHLSFSLSHVHIATLFFFFHVQHIFGGLFAFSSTTSTMAAFGIFCPKTTLGPRIVRFWGLGKSCIE